MVTGAEEADAGRFEREAAEVRAWIEREVGPVVAIERQPRWRPAWFVDVNRDGEITRLYVRGAREGLGNMSTLDEEGGMLRVLEAHGIPVPHVYGMIDEPQALVMDRLSGRAELSAVDGEERRAILDDYIGILVRTHAIDPGQFVADAGLRMPSGAQDIALNMFDRFEATYRRDKQRPEPLIEFGIKWVRANVPTHRNRARFVTCDSAQFMYEAARVTGLIDLELGYIGDPVHDLASFRLKDTVEPFGDVGGAMLRYEALSGEPLDVSALDFHTVQWSLCIPMTTCGVVHTAPPLPELMVYLGWFHQYALTTLDCLAQILGAPLPDVSLPNAMPTRDAGISAALPLTIRGLAADDPVALFRRDSTAAIAEYLRMTNAHGAAVEAADLDDVGELLGERPASWETGDAALERFVLDAGPEHNIALTQLFTRRTLRQLLLLEPTLKTGEIKRLAPLRKLLGRA